MLAQYKSNHKTTEKNPMMESKAYGDHVQLEEVKFLLTYQSMESSDVVIHNMCRREGTMQTTIEWQNM